MLLALIQAQLNYSFLNNWSIFLCIQSYPLISTEEETIENHARNICRSKKRLLPRNTSTISCRRLVMQTKPHVLMALAFVHCSGRRDRQGTYKHVILQGGRSGDLYTERIGGGVTSPRKGIIFHLPRCHCLLQQGNETSPLKAHNCQAPPGSQSSPKIRQQKLIFSRAK